MIEIAAGDLTSAQLNDQLTQVQNQFSLKHNYLWQAAHLTGFDDGRSRLFVALHHLVVDAVSWRILAEDVQLLRAIWPAPELPAKPAVIANGSLPLAIMRSKTSTKPTIGSARRGSSRA